MQRLLQHPRQVVRAGDSLLQPFATLLEAREPASSLHHALHRILFDFLAAPQQNEHSYSDLTRRALDVLTSNLSEPLATADLAKRLATSPATLTRHFSQDIGTTPADYLRRLRIAEAEKLLAAGHSVTDVAHQLGFCSSQYFATTYKKLTNRRPNQDRPPHSSAT